MNAPLCSYLLSLLLFGSNGIVASCIDLPSTDIVLLRTFLGAVTLIALLVATAHGNFMTPKYRREAFAIAASGAALGASWIFLFRAYQLIGVGVSSLLYYCGPIIVMALSPLLFRERLSTQKLLGFAAVAAGAFLIAAQGLGTSMPIEGVLCGGASALCYALMVICSKGAPHITGLENSTIQVTSSFVTTAILGLLTQGAPTFISLSPAGIDWTAVAVLGLVNTGLGCFLYFSGVAKLPVQTVAIVGYLEPLSAVVFSVALLGEMFTPTRLLGAMLIIGGALFCQMAGKRAASAAVLA